MDLNEIEERLKEIYKIRDRLLKEMKLDNNSGNRFSNDVITRQFKKSFSSLKEMKVACIVDEFTYFSLEPECKLLQITPYNWLQELEDFQPDLFFFESAWRGHNGLWKSKVSQPSSELMDIFDYCRKHEIPIVFWNKEDPAHFNTFIIAAKFADFVFTTDIDCIKEYKKILKHNRIYFMPFAAQIKYHNPMEIINRKDKFCFTGAYYKEFPDRSKDLETFVKIITSLKKDLVIYDRNYHKPNRNNKFPRLYKRYIAGYLKPEEIWKAYRGYRYHINMNSIKQSQSMCARRIFELLASNTVVFSNYSKAIRNFFGDLVICTDDGKRLKDEILKFDDLEYYKKFRLLGLRKVLSEHTYDKRLAFIVQKVYDILPQIEKKYVAIISKVNTTEELERIIYHFQRQSYQDKKLFIITDIIGNVVSKHFNSKHIEFIPQITDEMVENIQRKFQYWTFFSAHDYYGKNYIYDFVLALKFSDQPVISKATYFFYRDNCIRCSEEGQPYQSLETSQLRKSLINARCFSIEDLKNFTQNIEEGTVLTQGISIDEFNYCMNFTGYECKVVDDLDLANQGISMNAMEEIVEKVKNKVDV